jgi:hypothetical protein
MDTHLDDKSGDVSFTADSKAPPSSNQVEVGIVRDSYVIDKKLERRLLWKFDLYILPMLAVMYLFKYGKPYYLLLCDGIY